jgi:hypothetical protein
MVVSESKNVKRRWRLDRALITFGVGSTFLVGLDDGSFAVLVTVLDGITDVCQLLFDVAHHLQELELSKAESYSTGQYY